MWRKNYVGRSLVKRWGVHIFNGVGLSGGGVEKGRGRQWEVEERE